MPDDRSKDRHKPRATIASADDDGLWTELGEVVGENKRSEVTRALWAAFLKRPGPKMPPPYQVRKEGPARIGRGPQPCVASRHGRRRQAPASRALRVDSA